MFVNRDRTDAVSNDMSAGGILDVFDMSANVGFNGGILEHTVASLIERTILKNQILRIAQQLFTSQVTVDQSNIF